MKKLILLLLIPILTYSQTYNELMTIDSLDDFKRVMIENKYELDKIDDDGGLIYILLSINGDQSIREGRYWKDGSWQLQFGRKGSLLLLSQIMDYEDTVEGIRDNCSYVNIENIKEIDYVSYQCEYSDFDGKIGFMIREGVGFIRYFPNK